MNEKKYDLFPEEKPKENMEQESFDSSGLSIVPYLAVSRETGKKLGLIGHNESCRNGLKDYKYYIDNDSKFLYEKIATRYEKRNGFPLSFQKHNIKDAFYRERGEITYKIEISHHALIVKKSMYLPPVRQSYSERSYIVEYSMKSRKRFFEAMLTMDWKYIPQDNIRELTLTYPSIYPRDGRILKRHLDAYAKRLKKIWRSLWKNCVPLENGISKKRGSSFPFGINIRISYTIGETKELGFKVMEQSSIKMDQHTN